MDCNNTYSNTNPNTNAANACLSSRAASDRVTAKLKGDALSKKPHDGGPVFPAMPGDMAQGPCCYWGGMSLRDYFAAKAMQSLMEESHWLVWGWQGELRKGWETALADLTTTAYAIADAMLAERAKGGAA